MLYRLQFSHKETNVMHPSFKCTPYWRIGFCLDFGAVNSSVIFYLFVLATGLYKQENAMQWNLLHWLFWQQLTRAPRELKGKLRVLGGHCGWQVGLHNVWPYPMRTQSSRVWPTDHTHSQIIQISYLGDIRTTGVGSLYLESKRGWEERTRRHLFISIVHQKILPSFILSWTSTQSKSLSGKKELLAAPLCPDLHVIAQIRICHSFYTHIGDKVESNSWKRYKMPSTLCPSKGTIVLKTPILNTCLFLKTLNTGYSIASSDSLFQWFSHYNNNIAHY